MVDIIAAIDSATGCHHCGSALGDSPSDLFCTDGCQQAWHESRTVPLTGYDEPYDLPQHVGNLVELYSDEVIPAHSEVHGVTFPVLPSVDMAALAEQFAAYTQAWARMAEQVERAWRAAWQNHHLAWIDEVQWHGVVPLKSTGPEEQVLDASRFSPATFDLGTPDKPTQTGSGHVPTDVLLEVRQATFGEPLAVPSEVRGRALAGRRNRNTGPTRQHRPPRAINPRRTR